MITWWLMNHNSKMIEMNTSLAEAWTSPIGDPMRWRSPKTCHAQPNQLTPTRRLKCFKSPSHVKLHPPKHWCNCQMDLSCAQSAGTKKKKTDNMKNQTISQVADDSISLVQAYVCDTSRRFGKTGEKVKAQCDSCDDYSLCRAYDIV